MTNGNPEALPPKEPSFELTKKAQHLKAEWDMALKYVKATQLSKGWSLFSAHLKSNLGPGRGNKPAYFIDILLKREDGKTQTYRGNFLKLVREAKKAGFKLVDDVKNESPR